MTDPIADMLTRIRNAVKARLPVVEIQASKLKQQIARILTEERFISGYKLVALPGNKRFLRLYLKYHPDTGKPTIKGLERVSKPGRRVYLPKDEIKTVRSGIGITILSTSKGVITDSQARMLGVGGEVICKVW